MLGRHAEAYSRGIKAVTVEAIGTLESLGTPKSRSPLLDSFYAAAASLGGAAEHRQLA